MTRKVKSSRAKTVDALLKSGAVTPEVLPATRMENAAMRVQNGLGEAIGYGGGGGFAGQIPGVTTEPVSDPQGIFDSLRWFLVSNYRQVLGQAYAEIGLIQTVCDVPVDDAIRGGVELKSSQLSEDQIEELRLSFESDDLHHAGQAAKWGRLFGGAGVIVIVGDQDPSTPLNVEAIGPDTPLEFKSADLWELNWDRYQAFLDEDVSLETGEPLENEADQYFNYYGNRVHKSRVLTIKGITPPSHLKPRVRGWGLSVVEQLVRSINQYIKATNLAFEVMDEFKLDVFKIKNLTATLMAPNGTQQVAKRIQLAAWQKNYQNAMVMDAEDDFDHKQLSFSGLGDAMTGIKQQVAADVRMPLTKLFGISAAGFSSGEDDIEVYNAMVESQVRGRLKRDLLKMAELRCQKLFGLIPDDLTLNFKPLRVLSAVDEENVKTQKFNRIIQLKSQGLITDKELRDAINKGNLLDVTLDADEATLQAIEAEKAEKAAMLPGGEGGGGEATPKTSPTDKTGGKAKPAGKPIANAGDGWDEDKHPRASDGKFGSGGSSSSGGGKSGGGSVTKIGDHAAKKAFAEKIQAQYGEQIGEFHSSGDRKSALDAARELRKQGIHGTVWHVEGPKTGPKSVYAVAVPPGTGADVGKSGDDDEADKDAAIEAAHLKRTTELPKGWQVAGPPRSPRKGFMYADIDTDRGHIPTPEEFASHYPGYEVAEVKHVMKNPVRRKECFTLKLKKKESSDAGKSGDVATSEPSTGRGGAAPAEAAPKKLAKGDSVDLGNGYKAVFRETVFPEGRRKRTGEVSAGAFSIQDKNGEHVGAVHFRTFDAPEPLGQFTMIDTAGVESEHAGKGLGTKVYRQLVEQYGTLLSDNRSTSESASAVWKKLGAEPATKYTKELEAAGDSPLNLNGGPRYIVTRETMAKARTLKNILNWLSGEGEF